MASNYVGYDTVVKDRVSPLSAYGFIEQRDIISIKNQAISGTNVAKTKPIEENKITKISKSKDETLLEETLLEETSKKNNIDKTITQIILPYNDGITADGKPITPDPSKFKFGQLGINYSKGSETLSIKNTDYEIVEFSPFERTINEVKNLIGEIEGVETQTAIVEYDKNNKEIGVDVKVSTSVIDNIIHVDDNGLSVKFDVDYSTEGILKFTSNNVIKTVNLPLASFFEDGQYYDSYSQGGIIYKQVIVLRFKNAKQEVTTVIIPAEDLYNEYKFFGDNKGIKVEATKKDSGESDWNITISLVLRQSDSNILVNNEYGLYVFEVPFSQKFLPIPTSFRGPFPE
ncbi:MAG: hypothetical protein EZS28_045485, partial [Streblomastix strix]